MMDVQSVAQALEYLLTLSDNAKSLDNLPGTSVALSYEQGLYLQEQGLLEVLPLPEYNHLSERVEYPVQYCSG
ncbi:MAG: hypothetical protein Q7R96_01335 [Nanoarchaeota archaeon]|nr:hypothetical protein [Nanoarchaeota archaeon]